MKEIKNTPNAPAPVGPYNQATLANGTLYIAGQIPINPATGEIVNTDIEAVSYTHLRAHETREDLVCRLLLEKKK